jgi:hypothetical protein
MQLAMYWPRLLYTAEQKRTASAGMSGLRSTDEAQSLQICQTDSVN